MDITPDQDLKLFVNKVKEMLNLRFVKNELSPQINISYSSEEGHLKYQEKNIDEEDFRSFLLLFRQFISNDEPIFVFKIINLCEKYLKNDDAIHEIRGIRKGWSQIFQKNFGPEFRYNDKVITGEHAISLWINGYYFHNDRTKIAEIQDISFGEVSLSRMKMLMVIPTLIAIISQLGYGIEKCLDINLFHFD